MIRGDAVENDQVRYGYLGPAGTFTEAALLQVAPRAVHVPMPDVVSALEAVRTGVVDRAVVPIENSVEGGVTATLDTLGVGSPLVVVGEALVQISFVLAARAGTRLEDVTFVATHPHAWAQCRSTLGRLVPGVQHVPSTSTAAAAALLANQSEQEPVGFDAALVAPHSAAAYGLEVLAAGVEDNPGAVTRFVVVARPGVVPARTGADKTTLLVHLPHDEAGALLTMLEQFATRGVNLSRIESRPIGDSLGRYAFSLDADGHIADERVAAALTGLHRVCPYVLFLGSYPRADQRATVVEAGTTDADFAAAQDWVAQLRAGLEQA